jgi:Family of unknown function (DUF6491)
MLPGVGRRRTMVRTAILALVTSALTGCAAPPAANPAIAQRSGGQCFLATQVNSFTPTKAGSVDVRAGASRYFRLDLGGGCPNVDWSMRVGIRSVGGGSWICEGYDAELIVPEPGIGGRCPVSKVTAISKAQYLADQHL